MDERTNFKLSEGGTNTHTHIHTRGPVSTPRKQKLLTMASLNPPIADDLSQLAIPRHAVIVGFAGGSREVLLARRDGMHLDVRKCRFVYVV